MDWVHDVTRRGLTPYFASFSASKISFVSNYIIILACLSLKAITLLKKKSNLNLKNLNLKNLNIQLLIQIYIVMFFN
jgi:hypothetical protein